MPTACSLCLGRSYRSLAIMSAKQIEKQGRGQLLRNFLSRGYDIEVFDDWLQVQRIIASRKVKGKV